MKVRITQLPKQGIQRKGITPFNNPYDEQTPEMAYGGNIPSSGPVGNNRRIDMSWDSMGENGGNFTQRNPYGRVGHVLPETEIVHAPELGGYFRKRKKN